MPLNINNATQIQQNQTMQATTANNIANANNVDTIDTPPFMQGASPSAGKIIGRFFAALFTLGISEAVIVARENRAYKAEQARLIQQNPHPEAAPQADAANTSLANALRLNKPLAEDMKAAMSEGIQSLHDKFGELVPENGTVPQDITAKVAERIRTEQEEVNPQRLKALTTEVAQQAFAEKSMLGHIQTILQDVELNTSPRNLFPHGDGNNNFTARLSQCADNAAVQNLFNEFEQGIHTQATRRKAVDTLNQEMRASAYEKLSEATGLSVDTLAAGRVLNKIEGKVTALCTELLNTYPLPENDAMKERFIALADSVVNTKIPLYTSIAGFEIS